MSEHWKKKYLQKWDWDLPFLHVCFFAEVLNELARAELPGDVLRTLHEMQSLRIQINECLELMSTCCIYNLLIYCTDI